MKKVPYSTSRVLWEMGQPLLPEHFYAQEQSLREESNLRLALLVSPSWGVGSLKWDGAQLLKGIISIEELSLVLPSGTLIDVPGNTASTFLNLNAAGARASVYIHLHGAFEPVSRRGGADVPNEGIKRILHKIELSTNPYTDSGAQSFKLAELNCGPDGRWSLSTTFIPPLLQVGYASPFFEPLLQKLDGVLRTLRQALVTEAHEDYLMATGNVLGRGALRSVFEVQALLVDMQVGMTLHPYQLFQALRGLYISLCVYRDVLPTEIEKPYRHDALADCFNLLMDRLEEQAQVNRQTIPYQEFSRRDGLYECELNREVRRARDVFFLVQKPQASAKLDLSRTKLASESRIQLVYERALRGIPYQHIEKPPFHHGLSATVEFYSIAPGHEWDCALREGKLVFLDGPQMQGSRFYLYWRGELAQLPTKNVAPSDSLARGATLSRA